MAVKKYKLEDVKAELEKMGFVKDGLIGFAKSNGGFAGAYLGGMIGAMIANSVAEHYAIVKFNEKIMIIPYESGKINYDKAMSYEKENIEKMKLSVYNYLKIKTKDGKKKKVFIEKGHKDVKAMIEALGFGKKK